MQPNQPTPPGSNPYEFITNTTKPPRRPILGGSQSFATRILIIVGGAVVLMIIAVVALSLFGASETDVKALKNVAVKQQELIRVAAIGSEKSNDSTLRAKAKIIEQSTTSQLQAMTNYLEKRGVALSKEELAAGLNNTTDNTLNSAASSNQFDQVFSQTLDRALADYANTLQLLYQAASDDSLKAVLEQAFNSTSTAISSEPSS